MKVLFDIDSLFYKSVYKCFTPTLTELKNIYSEIETETISDFDHIDLNKKELSALISKKFKKLILDEVLNEAITRLWLMIDEIMLLLDKKFFEPLEQEFFVTQCKNSIRKEISEDYKSNRKKDRYVQELRALFIATSNANFDDVYEADDLVYDRAKELGIGNYIVVTMDKDLKQIGGFYFNFYKEKVKVNGEYKLNDWGNPIYEFKHQIEFIEQKEADTFLATQMLMGDSGDRIKGIPKIGIKTAEKLLKDCKTNLHLKCVVMREYNRYYGEDYLEYLLLNYRLLKLGKSL